MYPHLSDIVTYFLIYCQRSVYQIEIEVELSMAARMSPPQEGVTKRRLHERHSRGRGMEVLLRFSIELVEAVALFIVVSP